MPLPVILIFDVGKTNKKALLFDEHYNQLEERCTQLPETRDEDGFPCENVEILSLWLKREFAAVMSSKNVSVRAINFSAYGASFVHLDRELNVCTPLYNYLKLYPENLEKKFYAAYGGESLIASQTASPMLGSLNSGLQLYRLKHERPDVYEQIRFSLHLPQYLSFLFSGVPATDFSSVGCHTMLWDFQKNNYHQWVRNEGLDKKFAPLHKADEILARLDHGRIQVGTGLHDSSAALIPYLVTGAEPFVLISTGTWCISINPFNQMALTDDELKHDCLCYLTWEGKAVKASRLFAGHQHDEQTKRLAKHFVKEVSTCHLIEYNLSWVTDLSSTKRVQKKFDQRELSEFGSYEEAYHHLVWDIVQQQAMSTNLVLNGTSVKTIFVDGGFARNSIYMNLLAKRFPTCKVFGAVIPQASALGAALVIHRSWNNCPLPTNLVELKHFPK